MNSRALLFLAGFLVSISPAAAQSWRVAQAETGATSAQTKTDAEPAAPRPATAAKPRRAKKTSQAAHEPARKSGAAIVKEGGGHVGRIGTIALVPRVVDQVRIPVIAAGGLADGRGLVAALALGAAGVWMGTRFIATAEARGHENYKRRITEIDEDGTVITRAHSGKPNRMIANDFTRSWTGREAEIKPYPHQLKDVGETASYRGRIEGDVTHGVLPCGQSAGLISQVERAATVVENIARQATEVLSRLPRTASGTGAAM